jgi:hypothetical protein
MVRAGPEGMRRETQAVEQPPQQPPQPPRQPEPQPWGGRPWGQQAPRPQPPPPQWGERPAPRQPWGYRPPPADKQPPGTPPPWWRQPVGLLLIGAVVVIVLALVVPMFTGGGSNPAPTVTTGAFGTPGTTAPPAATTTTSGRPPTTEEQLGQAVQDELGTAGKVVSVTAPTGGPVTVTWEITQAGSPGLTRNNARFGVMRIMRVIQQISAAAGADAPTVRLLGRYRLAGSASEVTVVRLRFDPSTVERGDFDDRRYLEAFELADAAAIHPTFRG